MEKSTVSSHKEAILDMFFVIHTKNILVRFSMITFEDIEQHTIKSFHNFFKSYGFMGSKPVKVMIKEMLYLEYLDDVFMQEI